MILGLEFVPWLLLKTFRTTDVLNVQHEILNMKQTQWINRRARAL